MWALLLLKISLVLLKICLRASASTRVPSSLRISLRNYSSTLNLFKSFFYRELSETSFSTSDLFGGFFYLASTCIEGSSIRDLFGGIFSICAPHSQRTEHSNNMTGQTRDGQTPLQSVRVRVCGCVCLYVCVSMYDTPTTISSSNSSSSSSSS